MRCAIIDCLFAFDFAKPRSFYTTETAIGHVFSGTQWFFSFNPHCEKYILHLPPHRLVLVAVVVRVDEDTDDFVDRCGAKKLEKTWYKICVESTKTVILSDVKLVLSWCKLKKGVCRILYFKKPCVYRQT